MAAHEEIFLSYSHDDRVIAQQLVQIFRSHKWSVFSDRQLPSDVSWQQRIDEKLKAVRCVVVLWSRNSVRTRENTQHWVLEEANTGFSRGVYASAKLDDCELPFGFRSLQSNDLSTWNGEESHPGLAALLARVQHLLTLKPNPVSGDQDDELRRSKLPPSARDYSVSDLQADRECILAEVRDQRDEIRAEIVNGYELIASAQRAALEQVDDQAPRTHFKSAAQSFKTALHHLGEAAHRKLAQRSGMPVEYFIRMEFANSLVFSESDPRVTPKEALDVYEELARRYPDDTAVFLRMGQAKLRSARTRHGIQDAIRDLNRALSNAQFDPLVTEHSWVHFEAPLRIGLSFWRISELPGIADDRRAESMRLALSTTRPVADRKLPPAGEGVELARYNIIKAAGNSIYYRAALVRMGREQKEDREELESEIKAILSEANRAILEKQPAIIDSLAFAATTIGLWDIALAAARRNVENFRQVEQERGLNDDELAMKARAIETAFLIEHLRPRTS